MTQTLEELKREADELYEVWLDAEDGTAEEAVAHDMYVEAKKRYLKLYLAAKYKVNL